MRYVPFLFALLALGVLAPCGAAEDPPPPEAAPEAGPDADEATYPNPSEALRAIQLRVLEAPRSRQRTLQRELTEAYLADFEADDDSLTPDDLVALGMMRRTTEAWTASAGRFAAVLAHTDASQAVRDRAVTYLCSVLRLPAFREAAGDELVDGYRVVLEMVLADREGEDGRAARGTVLQTLAGYAEREHEDEKAVALYLRSAREVPRTVGTAARQITRLLQGKPWPVDAYDDLRARARPVFAELTQLATAYRDGLPEDANERAKRTAERTVTTLEKAFLPFELLGEPAPAWTLHHAFGDVKRLEDLKGKVVVVDFWATWCGWCIKSFPAIRMLLEEHAEDPLVFLGVTQPFPYVYEARYDLDDDMKDKVEAGVRPKPAALLEGQRAREGVPMLPEAEYRKKEIEVLDRFIENHEITWPMLMVDAGEPAEKYALKGWPHAMVLDKHGRIRFFKSGALLKDRPDALESFRKKLRMLLDEK